MRLQTAAAITYTTTTVVRVAWPHLNKHTQEQMLLWPRWTHLTCYCTCPWGCHPDVRGVVSPLSGNCPLGPICLPWVKELFIFHPVDLISIPVTLMFAVINGVCSAGKQIHSRRVRLPQWLAEVRARGVSASRRNPLAQAFRNTTEPSNTATQTRKWTEYF